MADAFVSNAHDEQTIDPADLDTLLSFTREENARDRNLRLRVSRAMPLRDVVLVHLVVNLALALPADGFPGEDHPRLRLTQSMPGPDGHVAFHGSLKTPFCFGNSMGCDNICLPAGAVVDLTQSACGPRSNVGCAATTTLHQFRAVRPTTVCGVVFAGGSEVSLGNGRVGGRLATSTSIGDRVVRDDVAVVISDGAPLMAVRGTLAAPAVIAGFAAPAGFLFDVENAPSGSVSLKRVRGRDHLIRVDAQTPKTLRSVERFVIADTVVEKSVVEGDLVGLSFKGVITFRRTTSAPSWQTASGALGRSHQWGPLQVAASSTVSLCHIGDAVHLQSATGKMRLGRIDATSVAVRRSGGGCADEVIGYDVEGCRSGSVFISLAESNHAVCD